MREQKDTLLGPTAIRPPKETTSNTNLPSRCGPRPRRSSDTATAGTPPPPTQFKTQRVSCKGAAALNWWAYFRNEKGGSAKEPAKPRKAGPTRARPCGSVDQVRAASQGLLRAL